MAEFKRSLPLPLDGTYLEIYDIDVAIVFFFAVAEHWSIISYLTSTVSLKGK